MRVAIAGGHGKIALRLTRLLSDRGDEVTSLIRNPAHSAEVQEAGGEPVICDLEACDVQEIVEAIRGVDAVVFAAGAGPGSGPERKESMDYGGAVKLIDAASAAGISRYVMVSSVNADPNRQGDHTFDVYLRAKGRADAALQASGLEYTVVRPGRLTEDPGTGRVKLSDELEEIPRDDVANVLDAVLRNPKTAGATFGVTGGDMPVDQIGNALAR